VGQLGTGRPDFPGEKISSSASRPNYLTAENFRFGWLEVAALDDADFMSTMVVSRLSRYRRIRG
jgi:hypothetical protein